MADFYRFRRAGAVLDEFHELERQEIYFAPIEELNDPMEGYKDVFWLGDTVVWHNLLRHFILISMLMAHRHLGGPLFGEADIRKVIRCTADDLPVPPATARQVYADICSRFFHAPGIAALVNKLGSRTHPMRREELAHYLRALYPFIVHLLFAHPSLEEAIKTTLAPESVNEQLERMNRTLENLGTLSAEQLRSAEAMFVAGEVNAAQEQIRTDLRLGGPQPPFTAMFSYNFASTYVRALDELVHFPAYFACFARTATNASMWGTYGDSHRGVCLKFSAPAGAAGDAALQLKTIVGWSGSTNGPVTPNFGFREHPIRDVRYSNAYPETDFFRSLGHLPQQAVNRFWFRNEAGQESPIRTAIAEDEENWRKGYWANFEAGLTCKTVDWSHEQEARIVLHSILGSYEERQYRKLQYRFQDLSAIVFGINTREVDKVAIVKITAAKCKAEGRADFAFFQTRYLRQQQRFEIIPLFLL